jgi:hypothetical protein
MNNQAENVEKRRSTAKESNPASPESASDKASTPERGGGEKEKPHGFSKKVAEKKKDGKKLGYNAAIILRYLSYLYRKCGKDIGNKRWVRVNLDHISDQYSYMGRSTIDDAVQKLKEFGACEVASMNGYFTRRSYDRTNCFHIPKEWRDMAEEEIRYFLPSVAEEVGVPAATIYYNFMHWIGEWYEEGVEPRAELCPSVIVKLQPFSKATIKRALAELKEKGFIASLKNNSWYVEGARKAGSSNPDEQGSNPDKGSSNPDEGRSDPDNYNSCSELKVDLEKSSKEPPAAAVSHSAPRGEMQNDASGSSIATEAAQRERSESCRDADPHPATESSSATASDTSGSAGSAGGEWPPMESLAHVHAINRSNAKAAEELFTKPKYGAQFFAVASGLVRSFFAKLSPEWLDQVYEDADANTLFTTLLPKYQQFLSTTRLRRDSPHFEIYYYGVLECIVGAIVYRRGHDDPYHQWNTQFMRLSYEFHLPLRKRAEAKRLKAVDQEFNELREAHASRDEDLEGEADLSPAEKTRYFRNGLNAMNKIGWIAFDQQHRTDEINSIKPALRLVRRLFELNPDTSAGDLLAVMEACMKLRMSRPAPGKFRKGVQWHARSANNLLNFVLWLPRIVEQLGMSDSCPFTVFLRDEVSADSENEAEAEVAA